MTSADVKLWREVSECLELRNGWSLQAQASPGTDSTWCFHSAGETELSITVENGAVCIYLVSRDEEVNLPDVERMVKWLDLNEGLFHERSLFSLESFEEMLHQKIEEWRQTD